MMQGTRCGGFFSLRLGHGTALTVPRTVIHYRAAASLPHAPGKGTSSPCNPNLRHKYLCRGRRHIYSLLKRFAKGKLHNV